MSSSSGRRWVVARSKKNNKNHKKRRNNNNNNNNNNNTNHIINLTADDNSTLPLNNSHQPFNNVVNFPQQLKATLIEISNTVTNGGHAAARCRKNTVTLESKKTYRDMRRDVSQWAIDNPDHPVAVQFTNLNF